MGNLEGFQLFPTQNLDFTGVNVTGLTADVADNSITTAKIVNGAVTDDKLASSYERLLFAGGTDAGITGLNVEKVIWTQQFPFPFNADEMIRAEGIVFCDNSIAAGNLTIRLYSANTKLFGVVVAAPGRFHDFCFDFRFFKINAGSHYSKYFTSIRENVGNLPMGDETLVVSTTAANQVHWNLTQNVTVDMANQNLELRVIGSSNATVTSRWRRFTIC